MSIIIVCCIGWVSVKASLVSILGGWGCSYGTVYASIVTTLAELVCTLASVVVFSAVTLSGEVYKAIVLTCFVLWGDYLGGVVLV